MERKRHDMGPFHGPEPWAFARNGYSLPFFVGSGFPILLENAIRVLNFAENEIRFVSLTKNEIKRRLRILLEREIFRPRFDEIERECQVEDARYSPRESYLCGTKQWLQHLEMTDREEQNKWKNEETFGVKNG